MQVDLNTILAGQLIMYTAKGVVLMLEEVYHTSNRASKSNLIMDIKKEQSEVENAEYFKSLDIVANQIEEMELNRKNYRKKLIAFTLLPTPADLIYAGHGLYKKVRNLLPSRQVAEP